MSNTADRVRAQRDRQKNGVAVVMFEVDEDGWTQVLHNAGFDTESLSAATKKFIDALIDRFQEGQTR